MSWLRLDDGFADHPKIVKLSDAAFRQHVRCLCYCARQLTDGVVPAAVAPSKRILAELIDAKLWKRRGHDFEIKDYLAYNPSRAQVEGQRRADSERKRRGRRPDSGEDSAGNPDGIQTESSGPLPLPLPVPTPDGSRKRELHTSEPRSRTTTPRSWEPDGADEEVCEGLMEALELNAATRARCRRCGLGAARLRVILRDVFDDDPATRKRPGGRVWAAVQLALRNGAP